ncbi:hypothetical protein, partial [Alkalicoccobacillus gibsonii]|uniref:hypothetical protein n=1 Tax=Alkalicoccobacillus gibsonii TaxID=79881 RepID=UPI001AED6C96
WVLGLSAVLLSDTPNVLSKMKNVHFFLMSVEVLDWEDVLLGSYCAWLGIRLFLLGIEGWVLI